MNKKKILHIITSLGDGGAEGVLYRLISETNNNIEHQVIALSSDNKYESLLRKKKIKLYKINLLKNKLEFSKLIKLYKIIKSKKDFLIQTWLYHADFLGGIFAFISGNRNIYWNIRTSEISLKSTKIRTLIIIFLNALLSWFVPKKIIICSKRSIKIHRLVGFKNNFELIYNGFDEKFYIPKKNYSRKYFNLSNNDLILGNVSRYHPVKNHEYLLSIFSKIRDIKGIKLVLIGTNMDKKNSDLVEMLKKKKIFDKTILLGRRDDVFHMYKIFDIFLLTSHSEGFPNVLAEAMLNKNICISTNVGEARNIIYRDKFIIQKNDIESSAKKIRKIILERKNLKKWNLLKSKNRKRIKNTFSLNKMIKNYINVWKN